MKLYNVEVIETLSKVVEQEANSYEEAEDIVYEKYRDGDIVLDWNDLEDTDFKPYPSQELKKSFNFNVDYDRTDKTIWIGTDNTSSERFRCKDKEHLISAIKTYIDNNIELENVKPEIDLSKNNKDMER